VSKKILGRRKGYAYRARFETNMAEKLHNAVFLSDIEPLLASGSFQADTFDEGSFHADPAEYDPAAAYRRVHSAFIALLPDDPWKGRKARKRKA
jgi:hypothetical protein